jgi:hypothetical protein
LLTDSLASTVEMGHDRYKICRTRSGNADPDVDRGGLLDPAAAG